MKNRFLLSSMTALLCAQATLSAAPEGSAMGIVNFSTCVTDSKLGKQEQASFESIKKQMSVLIEDTEKQLKEISDKLSDKEYLDGLSPEAEQQLNAKLHTLNEEMNKYQNQYYQVLNQANMRIIQSMSQEINNASEKVAKEKKIKLILNKEACFFSDDSLNLTDLVIGQMNKDFDAESKKEATAQSTAGVAAEPAVKTEKQAPTALAVEPTKTEAVKK